jgi:hypothetical protein
MKLIDVPNGWMKEIRKMCTACKLINLSKEKKLLEETNKKYKEAIADYNNSLKI